MGVTVAKSAGFCFGVRRAVDIVQKQADTGKKVATLGRIIHNPQVIEKFEKQGVTVIDSVSETPEGYGVVIRAHGAPKSAYDELELKNISYEDATCPCVARTHKVIKEAEKDGKIVFYAGDSGHPEVVGALGHASDECCVFANSDELKYLLEFFPKPNPYSIVMLAQTTFNRAEWDKCVEMVKKDCEDVKIVDTICDATTVRQKEADKLASQCQCMVVVGGRWSSNTYELARTCARHCQTILVESTKELDNYFLTGLSNIGITAGASTPNYVVEEVREYLEKKLSEEQEKRLKSGLQPLSDGPLLANDSYDDISYPSDLKDSVYKKLSMAISSIHEETGVNSDVIFNWMLEYELGI